MLCFAFRLGNDGVAADHDIGLSKLIRRLEPFAVNLHRLQQRLRCEVRGEGIGQPEHCSELRPEQAGAQNVERHVSVFAGDRV